MEVAIKRVDEKNILIIDDSSIPILDYSIKSSADGTTELNVTITGISSIFDLSTILEE